MVLVNLELFRIRSFAAGNVAVTVVSFGEFGLRHLAHFRVERRVGQHRDEIGPLLFLGAQVSDRAGDWLELRELPGNLRVFGARDPLAKAGPQFVMAAKDCVEICVDVHFGRSRKTRKIYGRKRGSRARYRRTARRWASARSGSRRLAWSPLDLSIESSSSRTAPAFKDRTIALSGPIAVADIDKCR